MADDKNLDKKGADDEPELVIVDKPITDAGDDKDKSRKRDARMDDDDDVDEGGHRDARMDDAGEHLRETQEQKRERRRKERHEERDRRRREDARKDAAIKALEDNNRRMQSELEALKQRSTASQAATIDQRMNDAVRMAQEGETALRDAVERADGTAAVLAQRKINAGTQQYRELEALKQRMQAQPQQRQDNGREAAPPIDPEVRRHVRRFQKDHPWYDGRGDDQDSAIVLTIDAKLTDEGYDPADQDYWDELRDRIERALPHRFDGSDDDDDDRPPARRVNGNGNGDGRRRGPPVRGNGGGSLRRNEVYISPDRKAALQAAGYWGDPEKMARLAKRYQQYDRENNK